MATLFEINLTCEECEAELVRVHSGLVCPNSHGTIKPVGETQDRSFMPINANGAGRLKQRSAKAAGDAIARAARAASRYEKRQRQLNMEVKS